MKDQKNKELLNTSLDIKARYDDINTGELYNKLLHITSHINI